MKTLTQPSSTRLNPTRGEGMFDLPSAISSGAINEQHLIAVLTEMCRCVLATKSSHLVSPTASDNAMPLETVVPASPAPG
jgi:hypothetical protein